MDLSVIREIFLQESDERLQTMEESLLALGRNPADREAVNSIFRSVHTIKGSAGMFGYPNLVAFTHSLENYLDKMRKSDINVSDSIVSCLLKARDLIGELIELETGSDPVPATVQRESENILHELGEAPGSLQSPVTGNDVATGNGISEYAISIRPAPDLLIHGIDPIPALAYLRRSGEFLNLEIIPFRFPDTGSFHPEQIYLGYELIYRGPLDVSGIRDALEFLVDDCTIRIARRDRPDELQDLITSENDPETRKLLQSFYGWNTTTPAPQPEGLPRNPATTAEPEVTITRNADSTGETRKSARQIRIDASKLDSLINLVGELVITSERIRQLSESTTGDLPEAAFLLSRLVEDLRDNVMNIRMVPIGATLQRFERVIHDISRELGKEVTLEIIGGDTELDKNLVENISDPLMHLVRNSMDHGIETPEERRSAGKPPRATITLRAFQDTGSIVIEVSDDGRGLNRERILAKAAEAGLPLPGNQAEDKDIWQFIFQPGFSTAEKVTSISGRGVGMDVVRKNIENLRGNIEIESCKGQGTVIRIRLPLTLAIIDGFLVGTANQKFILPLEMVYECVTRKDYPVQAGDCIDLRGEVMPLLSLQEFFGLSSQGEAGNIIIVRQGKRKAGILVDQLFGESQTVIKPLGRIFEKIRGISGATLLGTGQVALIIDVPRLLDAARTAGAGV